MTSEPGFYQNPTKCLKCLSFTYSISGLCELCWSLEYMNPALGVPYKTEPLTVKEYIVVVNEHASCLLKEGNIYNQFPGGFLSLDFKEGDTIVITVKRKI